MMKINKIFHILLLLAAMTLTQSCLKDDVRVFEESTSGRMTQFLNKTRQTLLAAEHGWALELYPASSESITHNQGQGGFVYTLAFDNQNVSVRSELMGDSEKEETSFWSLTNDNGPVITFDTYNSIFHYFSTPSSGEYQAKFGEFEFVIMDVKDDVIKLMGKKTGNISYMYRLNESAKDYLDKVAATSANFVVETFEGSINGKTINAALDLDHRQVTFSNAAEGEEAENTSVAFALTDRGIRLYEEVEVAGVKLHDLAYDNESLKVSAMNGTEKVADFDCQLPENYKLFDYYLGSMSFRYGNAGVYKVNVTLEDSGDGRNYILKGLNPNFNVVVNYVKSKGLLQICSQKVADLDEGKQLWLCANSEADGYFTWGTSYGMRTQSSNNTTFKWEDNGVWKTHQASAFMLAIFDGNPSSDAYLREETAAIDKNTWGMGSRKDIKLTKMYSIVKQ